MPQIRRIVVAQVGENLTMLTKMSIELAQELNQTVYIYLNDTTLECTPASKEQDIYNQFFKNR